MSPRDALLRITAPFAPHKKEGIPPAAQGNAAHERLAVLMQEISTLSVDDVAPTARPFERRNPSTALHWFPIWDALALTFAFLVACVFAAIGNIYFLGRPFVAEIPDLVMQGAEVSIISLGVLIWFAHSGHYSRRMPFWLEAQKIVNAYSLALLLNGFALFAAKQDFSRLWVMSGWGFAILATLLFRHLARRHLRRRGLWQVRTLLVGSGAMADEARAALRSEPSLGYEIVMQTENLPLLLGRVGNSWESLCARFNADFVLIALDGIGLAHADEAIAALVRSDIPFSVSPPLRHLPVLGMIPHYFFNHDVILMTPHNGLEQPLPRMIKRAMDVVVSAFALLLLAPLFAGLALGIKADGGPVFFGHKRVGYRGKEFNCLKFRSMRGDSDKVLEKFLTDHPGHRAEWETYRKFRDADPRVTKLGDFIRRWSIDELPQLINVLKGDMSLVGPRPVVAEEVKMYKKNAREYTSVRPGLTGLWQVSGRSNVSFARRVQMDAWYVRNWSLWHDIAIICKTIPVVIKKSGAC